MTARFRLSFFYASFASEMLIAFQKAIDKVLSVASKAAPAARFRGEWDGSKQPHA
jgi:hypothetical protein